MPVPLALAWLSTRVLWRPPPETTKLSSATASAPASEKIRYGTSAFPARRSYLVVTGRRRWMAEDPRDGELERFLAERGGHLLSASVRLGRSKEASHGLGARALGK